MKQIEQALFSSASSNCTHQKDLNQPQKENYLEKQKQKQKKHCFCVHHHFFKLEES